MKSLFTLLLLLFTAVRPTHSQEASLLFFGDIMGHDAQIASALQADGSYNYEPVFQYIEPAFRSADIVVGNLEVTLAGPPYAGYPAFTSPDALAEALKASGVNTLVTANNHSYDKGQRGMQRTLQVLDSLYFVRTGTFRDSADQALHHPKLIEINGLRLALLNYTYGTNGIAVRPPNIVNHIVPEQIKADLAQAREMKVDQIIVCIHWGNEYQTSPHADQQATAQLLFDHGADIIIGSHPHVVQPMHLQRDENGDRLVVYSLGNFVSNQRKEYTDGGSMVRIELKKENGSTRIKNAEHLLTWVHTPQENGKRRYYVLPASWYQQEGLPEHLSPAQSGMDSYLRKARSVMQNNTNLPESTTPWPLL